MHLNLCTTILIIFYITSFTLLIIRDTIQTLYTVYIYISHILEQHRSFTEEKMAQIVRV